MDSPKTLWSSQPFKAIYVAYFLVKTPVHLLLLSCAYLLKPLRPLPAWSAKHNIGAAAARMLFAFWTATRNQRPVYTAPEEAGERHVRVEPPPPGSFGGVAAASDHVRPAPVDAVWFPGPPPPDREAIARQKFVLHFPGGAFVLAFSHEKSGRPIVDLLNRHLGADGGVWAQYRLSGDPGARFPGAVQDAITFYRYLLSLGAAPANILVSGDSAGGNVAVALARYLQDGQAAGGGEALPLPGGIAVFSPWVHVTPTAARDYDDAPAARADVLHSSVLQWGADAYRPPGRPSPEVESYISPLHHPFALSVPLFVQAGTAEGMYGHIRSFAEEMASVAGNRVLFSSTLLAPHNLPFCHEQFGKKKELEDCLDEARGFIWPEK